MTRTKIRIDDDQTLRDQLDEEYERSSKIRICRYALKLADHVLEMIGYPADETIRQGFLANERWQEGKAGISYLREAALKIHGLARYCDDKTVSAALRVCGHAVACGHMKEHAMVASNYAVRVVNLLHPGDSNAVRKERDWQLRTLKETE